MRKIQIIMVGALCAALGAGAATVEWSENFDGLSALPANLTSGPGQGTVTISVANDQVEWSATDGRQFVVTTETDHDASDFIFEATFTIDGNTAYDSVFVGLGTGGVASWMPTGLSMALLIDPRSGQGVSTVVNAVAGADTAVAGLVGTHRIKMEWDSGTEEMDFYLDAGYTGTFSADYTVENFTGISFASNPSANASIFFGGGSGVTFDDVSVAIPEPATLGLIATFGGGMLFVRRKMMI